MSREPSLKERLSAEFIAAFEADFAENGPDAIKRIREKYPQHYLMIGAQLITKAEEQPGITDFSDCESQQDIARKLLMQVGVSEFHMTERILEKAAESNARHVAELEEIAKEALQ